MGQERQYWLYYPFPIHEDKMLDRRASLTPGDRGDSADGSLHDAHAPSIAKRGAEVKGACGACSHFVLLWSHNVSGL